jgi:hypothetical protein
MYETLEIARFALSNFERGLENLTDEQARQRMQKADGTEMNAISWIVAHLGRHWLSAGLVANGGSIPDKWARFASGSTDATPPSLAEALEVLHAAQASIDWIAKADEELMARPAGAHDAEENIGTRIMRGALHSWFHIGEINAIRQLQGYPPISFVGRMAGQLEWHRATVAPTTTGR